MDENNKVIKPNKGVVTILILLILLTLSLSGYSLYNKLISNDVKIDEKKDTNEKENETINKDIVDINNLDDEKVEILIKEQLIKLANSEGIVIEEGQKIAEAHIILGKYVKDDIAYYELYSEYGAFAKEGTNINLKSGAGSPVLIGINKEYEVKIVRIPRDSPYYADDIKDMFEEDIANIAIDPTESTKKLESNNYYEQLNSYFID